jgi:hypothetical protein
LNEVRDDVIGDADASVEKSKHEKALQRVGETGGWRRPA